MALRRSLQLICLGVPGADVLSLERFGGLDEPPAGMEKCLKEVKSRAITSGESALLDWQ